MELSSKWSTLKGKVDNDSALLYYIDKDIDDDIASYRVFICETGTILYARIHGVDLTTFETSYKSSATEITKISDIESGHQQPVKVTGFKEYSKEVASLYRESVKQVVTANDTTNIDKKFTVPVYLYGGIYEVIGDITDGDYFEMQVVDVDNLLGYGAGVVLSTFVVKEYINSERKYGIVESDAGDKIPTGIYLRSKYVSVGSNTPTLIVRYKMRK